MNTVDGRIMGSKCLSVLAWGWLVLTPSAFAQGAPPGPPPGAAQDLSKKLVNPVADIVSIPFQFNWINGIGPKKELRNVLNIQPVMPFSVNEKWLLVARWIMPYVSQPASFGASEGFSDIVASAFLSPKDSGEWEWGAGPVVRLPSTSDPTLGTGKWSAGPTFAMLKQRGPMTYVLLTNQLWSFASTSTEDRPEVSQALIEPVVAHSSPSGVTWTLMSETTVDWFAADGDKWTVPLVVQLSKITRLGPFPFSVGAGGGGYLAKPDGGPDWQLRTVFTLILPRSGGAGPR